jgi:hypothetical protein
MQVKYSGIRVCVHINPNSEMNTRPDAFSLHVAPSSSRRRRRRTRERRAKRDGNFGARQSEERKDLSKR